MRLLLPTLFLLTSTAIAQNPAPPTQPPPNQVQTFPTPNSKDMATAVMTMERMLAGGCPVGFSAQQRGSGQTLWTIALEDKERRSPGRPYPSDTGVHVDLNSRLHAIRQVELAVSFLAPGARVVPLSARPSSLPPLSKTFTLSAADGTAFKLAGNLLIGATAGILRVKLLSIDYSDGTSWQPSAGHGCSVEPNRLLLVDATAH